MADPPLIVPIDDVVLEGTEWENPTPLIKKLLASYVRTLGRHHHPLEEYRYVHVARKVVGVGSVGTRCYILLLLGRDQNDPLFLQVKEAQASVLERYLGASPYAHHGERVVAGQRLMQAATDIFLGWQRIKGLDGVTRDYYVRQFQDWKGGPDVDELQVTGRDVLRARLRRDARAGARALGRPDRDRLLPRQARDVRPRDRGLRLGVRRPERARLRGVRGGRALGAPRGALRPVGTRSGGDETEERSLGDQAGIGVAQHQRGRRVRSARRLAVVHAQGVVAEPGDVGRA